MVLIYFYFYILMGQANMLQFTQPELAEDLLRVRAAGL